MFGSGKGSAVRSDYSGSGKGSAVRSDYSEVGQDKSEHDSVESGTQHSQTGQSKPEHGSGGPDKAVA